MIGSCKSLNGLNIFNRFITEDEINFIRPLEDVIVSSMGHHATFECQLSREVKDFAWLKNGRPVLADQKHRLTQEGAVYRLTLSHIEPEDATEYAFSVRSKKSRAKLIPRGKGACCQASNCVFCNSL